MMIDAWETDKFEQTLLTTRLSWTFLFMTRREKESERTNWFNLHMKPQKLIQTKPKVQTNLKRLRAIILITKKQRGFCYAEPSTEKKG